MIGLPTNVSTSTANAFIETSIAPLAAPKKNNKSASVVRPLAKVGPGRTTQ